MTVFEGGDAIKEFLEDIDLGLSVVSEFEHVYQTLTSRGFAVVDEPTEVFEDVGKAVELHHDARGLQIDLFERQVVGKLWITDRMYAPSRFSSATARGFDSGTSAAASGQHGQSRSGAC